MTYFNVEQYFVPALLDHTVRRYLSAADRAAVEAFVAPLGAGRFRLMHATGGGVCAIAGPTDEPLQSVAFIPQGVA